MRLLRVSVILGHRTGVDRESRRGSAEDDTYPLDRSVVTCLLVVPLVRVGGGSPFLYSFTLLNVSDEKTSNTEPVCGVVSGHVTLFLFPN